MTQYISNIMTKLTLFTFTSQNVIVQQVNFIRCSGYDGGGIFVTQPVKTIHVNKSIFEGCSAYRGSVIFSSRLEYNSFNSVCVFKCSGEQIGSFYFHNTNLGINNSLTTELYLDRKGNLFNFYSDQANVNMHCLQHFK